MTISVTSTEAQEAPAHSGFWALTLGGIGVVFGDIGTSPLLCLSRSGLAGRHGEPISRTIVLGRSAYPGAFVVVTAKYVLLLLRADNNGEAGTFFPDGAGAARAEKAKLPGACARRGRGLNINRQL